MLPHQWIFIDTEQRQFFRLFQRQQNFFQAEQIGDAIRTYEVDVRRLCFILSACANGYYKENKEKFNFFNCTIVEPDEQSWSIDSKQ